MITTATTFVLEDRDLSRPAASLGVLELTGDGSERADAGGPILYRGAKHDIALVCEALGIADDPDRAVTIWVRDQEGVHPALFAVRGEVVVRILVFDGGCVITEPSPLDALIDELVADIGFDASADSPASDEISPEVMMALAAISGDFGLVDGPVLRTSALERLEKQGIGSTGEAILDGLIADGVLVDGAAGLRAEESFMDGPGLMLGRERVEIAVWHPGAGEEVTKTIAVGVPGQRRVVIPPGPHRERLIVARMRHRDVRNTIGLLVSGLLSEGAQNVGTGSAPLLVIRVDELAAALAWTRLEEGSEERTAARVLLQSRGLVSSRGEGSSDLDWDLIARIDGGGPSIATSTSTPASETSRRLVPGDPALVITEHEGWIELDELECGDVADALAALLSFGDTEDEPGQVGVAGAAELSDLVDASWTTGDGPLGPCLAVHQVLALAGDDAGGVSGEELVLVESPRYGLLEVPFEGEEPAGTLVRLDRDELLLRLRDALGA